MRKKVIALLLAICLLVSVVPLSSALAKSAYIVPDSNSRYMTYNECWEWDYESLGYILNEIFARHGYVFNAGGAYDRFFRARPWYTPNQNSNNTVACYPQLNDIEWSNERLCKEVREDMRAQNTRNTSGKHYLDVIESGGFSALPGFINVRMNAGQKYSVYSAPSASSWRGANGRASVSTNGSVYAAGWENGWLLIMYETNNGSVRVGYIQNAMGNFTVPNLNFSHENAKVLENASLTDDPAVAGSAMRTLLAGETVTYLASYQNWMEWAYVEAVVNGQTARGFVPLSALDVGQDVG